MRVQSTDHQHTSQVLNAAARFYVRIYGNSAAQPTGIVNELLDAAHAADGGLDGQDIAETLDTPELGVSVDADGCHDIAVDDAELPIHRREF
jgi:hypothetical protein